MIKFRNASVTLTPSVVYQIMEQILLSSKKTRLHDDVLKIIYMHMDPLLPLPRLRMLSVTYRDLHLSL